MHSKRTAAAVHGRDFAQNLSTDIDHLPAYPFHLCLCPACSCSYHIYSLCQLTTLTIHNSLFHSRLKTYLFHITNLPTIDTIPASGLTPLTL